MRREGDGPPDQHSTLPVAVTRGRVERQAPEHAVVAFRTQTAPNPIASPALPDPAPLDAGSTLRHYEIIRKLGEGGMGAVFLARDTRLGRLVAIKMLLQHGGAGAERFLAEARATARCKHENIVIIHEVDEIRGAPYMVLEYLEGRTLRSWMAQRERTGASQSPAARGPLPTSLAVELILPVVRALGCAHQLGIVHRDLKPENILLTDTGLVKVLDFGIAKQLNATEISRMTGATVPIGPVLTEQGVRIGTLPYMSPEQLRGEDVDARSDLWAVGIILYELCTGARPFEPFTGTSLAEVTNLDTPMPRVSERRPDVGALGAIVDRCLKKRKDERFGSAEQLLAALAPPQPGRKALGGNADENPFAGLAALQETDAGRFFGRDRDVAVAVGRLRNQPLLAVAGPSGAGKSSFVRAGVIPALKRSVEQWEAFILRPGRTPLIALAEVLAQVSEASVSDALAASLHTQPGLLGARLRARCRTQGGQHRILLFIDSFEELYTQDIPPGERAAFIACITGVADDASSQLRVILCIRSDFLHRLADDRRLMTEVTRGLLFLPSMGRDGLREVLARPIEMVGYRYESEEMIERMLDALERTGSPLPLLQFTAAKLWEARDRARRLLTRDTYDTLGGVEGALSTHADAVLTALALPVQRLCRAVMLRLCTPERTRAVVSLGELRALADDGGSVEQVIHHLADARLLLIETGGEREGTTVELVHESLIERWARLKQWLGESEQDAQFLARLRAAAQQWEASDRTDGLLWRDRAAEEARAWFLRRRAELGTGAPLGCGNREGQYLLAVIALFERARRMRRRIAASAFALISVIAIVVSYLAIVAKREAARADREAAAAQVEAVQARDASRMLVAFQLRHRDPTTALAILREMEGRDVPRGWADLAFETLHGGLTLVVMPHSASIFSAVFSPDGTRIVIASKDGTAQVHNTDGTGAPMILRGHTALVYFAAFSPDGERIVTASFDSTARVWNAGGTGDPVILRGHTALISSAAFSPDGNQIVTASDDGTARVWSADGTGEPLVLRGHEGRVSSASFSPSGKRIVTASFDQTARVWNAGGTGEPLVHRHDDGVGAAAWSPDDTRIVTASQDRMARVWNADGTGEPLVLRGHDDLVYCAAFSPDGKRIATASADKTARVWNADGTGEPLVLRGHDDLVYSVAWKPDGKRIVTASEDRTVRVWNVDATRKPIVLYGHEDAVRSAAFSPDGKRIVTVSSDNSARVRSADGMGKPVVLFSHDAWLTSAAWSPDGKRIAAAFEDKTARVWNADGTGDALVLRGHVNAVRSVAWSPDGKCIVTASFDKTARVWDADRGGEMLVFRGHRGLVYSAAYSPDGERIVTASQDKTARVWNADGTGKILILSGHQGTVSSAAWSPDGERIVTASFDKTARVCNADGTGEPLILHGHARSVYSVAFSPDGKRIVTASDDGTARVWNADGTGEPFILEGHDGSVYSAAWSPDGERIVTASFDKTARVWIDLQPLRGTGDPRLWTATPYCPPIERRIELLSFPEAIAREISKRASAASNKPAKLPLNLERLCSRAARCRRRRSPVRRERRGGTS